ncbi:MAG: hypothetical protein KKE31_00690 [Planctomycetes bacterium]|nr:hypothetical protein [Planctomycetota bacterium]MBU2457140.1 hypothetical protein [Planctomycetota bacterium]
MTFSIAFDFLRICAIIPAMQNDKENDSEITPPRRPASPHRFASQIEAVGRGQESAPHSMPTFGDIMKNINKSPRRPASRETRGQEDTPKKEFVSEMVEKISRQDNEDFSTEVPSFNLGQQILSQQRKIAAFKRKSPLASNISDKTRQPVLANPVPIQSIPQAPASPQQKIIAEIVAREIQVMTAVKR